MNRREMLKKSMASTAIFSFGGLGSLSSSISTPTTSASTNQAATKGERYVSTVPDTLDLTDRAALAISPLLKFANSHEIDPRVTTDRSVCGPKYLEALALVRTMTGNEDALDFERQIMDTYLEEVRDDGLFYMPPQGPFSESWGSILGQGRLMLAWLAWHQRDGNDRWLRYLDRTSRAVQKLALYKDDYAYYPTELIFDARYVFCFREAGWKVKDEPQPVYLMRRDQAPDMADRDGHQVDARMGIPAYVSGPLRPLVRWNKLSGNVQALELAGKLAAYLNQPKLWIPFREPVEIGGSYRAHYSGHIHAHTMTLRALLEYANSTNNLGLKEFCRSGYEYTRTFGIARIGYVPEWTNNNLCEGCQIADTLALAIRLCDAGVGDYWDDVDSYVRNHLIEQQHTDPASKYYGVFCAGTYPTHLRNDDYAGCCTANCSDALYYAWESIVRHADGVATINLLLNRASRWLDIDSYLPYEGKVVLKNKTAESMRLRIPNWVDKNRVRARGGRGKLKLSWQGHYLVIDRVLPREEIVVEFHVPESVEKHIIPSSARGTSELFGLSPLPIEVDKIPVSRTDWNGIWYTCNFKGNTLVKIKPEQLPATLAQIPGGVTALYQRDRYQSDRTPLIKKARFAPSQVIEW
jgi:hypothetical protein